MSIRTRIAMAVSLVAALVASGVASAEPSSTPNGPWVTPEQEILLSAFTSNEELASRLEQIDRSSRHVEVEQAGTSGQGRPIWLAKAGDPDNTPVLIFTQQHGDEPHGTEAALRLLSRLGSGGAAGEILDELYVLVIPRVNPDGTEIPTRGNADFTAPPRNTGQCPAAGGSNPSGLGIFSTRFGSTADFSYDINRYHWGDWTDSWQYLCNDDGTGGSLYPTNPVPEALAVLGVYEQYQPIWAIDVHNQGFNVVDDETCDQTEVCRDGQYVTGSILWPTNSDVHAAAVDLSRQMAISLKERSLELGHVELTRYNGGSFAGIARNSYGLLGSERIAAGESGPVGGSVLFEVAGQVEGSVFINNGQKAIGKLTNGVTELLLSLLEDTADGALYAHDPATADTLILDNDRFLVNPHAG